jgi:hypothetical protein
VAAFRGLSRWRLMARKGVRGRLGRANSVAKTRRSWRENASVSGVKLHETNPSGPHWNPDASPDVTEATANEPEPKRPKDRPAWPRVYARNEPAVRARDASTTNQTNPSTQENRPARRRQSMRNEPEEGRQRPVRAPARDRENEPEKCETNPSARRPEARARAGRSRERSELSRVRAPDYGGDRRFERAR